MKPRVLIIDDDELVLELAFDALSPEFEVTLAPGPAEALAAADGAEFAVVCCDYTMPKMNGVELLEKLAVRLPSMRAVLLSGSDVAAARSSKVAFAVLAKPFRPSELLRLIRALAEGDLPLAGELVERWGVHTAKPVRFTGGS